MAIVSSSPSWTHAVQWPPDPVGRWQQAGKVTEGGLRDVPHLSLWNRCAICPRWRNWWIPKAERQSADFSNIVGSSLDILGTTHIISLLSPGRAVYVYTSVPRRSISRKPQWVPVTALRSYCFSCQLRWCRQRAGITEARYVDLHCFHGNTDTMKTTVKSLAILLYLFILSLFQLSL